MNALSNVFDILPVQSLLGFEVCFRDLAFEASFKEYAGSFKDDQFKAECYLDRFRFGRVEGFIVDLDESGNLSFSIRLDEDYFNLAELELLYVS